MRTATLALSIGIGAAAAAATACGGDDGDDLPRCPNPVSGTTIGFRSIGEVPGSAVLATSPPGDPRLFVVGQSGIIHLFKDEQRVPTPFLDLSADAAGPVLDGGERGLLGLAFHPRYADNGQFFVYYTTQTGGTGLRDVVARCAVSATNPDVASPGCTEILSIPDFADNHNGGMIEFGSDGYLYIGTGDGGGGGDPNENGQSLMDGSPKPASVALLGKILRIDVDRKAAGKEYGIPSDNPFAGGGGAPEIFVIGLRNPWRWSFDRKTGDMYIADVGQEQREEVTVLTPAQQRGANLGWNMYEGTSCYTGNCSPDGKIMPQFERSRADGWASITGGQVYRGTCYPDIVGQYFVADYASSQYVRARFRNGALEAEPLAGSLPQFPSSLHADSRGELYLTTTPPNGNGQVYRLEASP